ncbi:MAG: hypothetical protein IT462_11495 [Planctomycetes bacterium]|nr:hypothetical protein [Planctomycetota bacterium]
MREMTKSPVALAREVLAVGEAALPPFSSKFSKRTFTQAQLLAVLALRAFFKTDFRGICQLLSDFGELRDSLRLRKVPHYSTLCKAQERLDKKGASLPCLLPALNVPV